MMGAAPERLLDLLDSLGYHVAMYDRDWRCTYVNREAARAMGRAPEAVLGCTLATLFNNAADDLYARQVRDAVAGGRQVRGDRFHVGLERWFEDQVRLLPEGVLVLSRDVTVERDAERRSRSDVAARLEAEDALRHSRDVLSLAMRGGAMGAWSRDLTTNEVWWSPELEHIVGLGPGAFGQTNDAFFELVHDDDRAAVQAGGRPRRRRPAPTTSSTSASATPAANGAGWRGAAARRMRRTAARDRSTASAST